MTGTIQQPRVALRRNRKKNAFRPEGEGGYKVLSREGLFRFKEEKYRRSFFLVFSSLSSAWLRAYSALGPTTTRGKADCVTIASVDKRREKWIERLTACLVGWDGSQQRWDSI